MFDNPLPNPIIDVETSDFCLFKIDAQILVHSSAIVYQKIMARNSPTDVIKLDVDAPTLQKIMVWATEYRNVDLDTITYDDGLNDFDTDFADLDTELLEELLVAARYMDIMPLEELLKIAIDHAIEFERAFLQQLEESDDDDDPYDQFEQYDQYEENDDAFFD